MDFKVIEKQVLSSDGVHYLKGKLYIPSGDIKGYVQVVHGMTEHIGRYNEFMQKMAGFGYLTFAFDNLGHGKTANSLDELGYIAKKNGYKLLLNDVLVFYNSVKAEYGDYSYTLMGHSMGSFIVRCAAIKTLLPNKLIVMGTSGKNKLAGLGILFVKILKIFKGDRHISKLLDKIAIGGYNKKFISEGNRRSWLTTDKEVWAKYEKDELCNRRFSLSAMQDLITLNKIANSNKWYKKVDKNMPILLISGSDDPVGKFEKGVKEVYNNLIKNGKKAQIKLYKKARHEILSEPNVKDKVVEDILKFIEE